MKLFDSIKQSQVIKKQLSTSKNPIHGNTKGWNAKSDKKYDNTEENTTYNLIIVDESGSMCSIFSEALTGINETLQTIRQAVRDYPNQKQYVTLVTFDTGHYNEIYNCTPGEATGEIDNTMYKPCGGTPLYDAVGKAVTDLSKMVTEDDHVLVTIITDGYENASCEYTVDDIKKLVETLKEIGWLFTYIGANQDSVEVGKQLSIVNTLNFTASSAGTMEMFAREMKSRKKYYSKRANNIEIEEDGYFQ